MTLKELKRIRDNVDHLIMLNSFLSTSFKHDVAGMWVGNGEDRPIFESVIFEIIIDESELRDASIIFADITLESNFEDEREVLLAIGTTLCIKSVEPEGNVWKISLHAYPSRGQLLWDFEKLIPSYQSRFAESDNFALIMIAAILIETGNLEKAEQITQLLSLGNDTWVDIFQNFLKSIAKIQWFNKTGLRSGSLSTEFIEDCSKLKETFQHMRLFLESDDSKYLDWIRYIEENIDAVIKSKFDYSTILRTWKARFLRSTVEKEYLSFIDGNPLRDSTITNSTTMLNDKDAKNEPFESTNVEEMWAVLDRCTAKDNYSRAAFLSLMAKDAKDNKNYELAIKFFRKAVLERCSDSQRARFYYQLGTIYEIQENWPAALECYENTINMSETLELLQMCRHAHRHCAEIYQQINDDHNALLHQQKALQIYCQQQSSQDLYFTGGKMLIGLKFTLLGDDDAALKCFQEVIELDHPEHTRDAYQYSGIIYLKREDFEMAHYSFIQSLEISQNEFPSDMDFIIKIHINLAQVEYLRDRFDEADVHIDKVLVLSTEYRCTEETRQSIQNTLKILPRLSRHALVIENLSHAVQHYTT